LQDQSSGVAYEVLFVQFKAKSCFVFTGRQYRQ